jgi:hypothetical protein
MFARLAGEQLLGGLLAPNAEIIAGPAHGIEHRLRGIQEAKPIWPPVVVRAAVSILLGEV